MLSIPHLIIIFVVALVFFGPEKLPELARNVGKFMVEFRRITGEFKGTLDDHLRDLEREGNARRAAADAAAAAVKAQKDAELNAAAQASALPTSTPAEAVASPETTGTTETSAAPATEALPESPAAPTGPTITKAEGIVPSADPRVVSQPATERDPHEDSSDSPAAGSSNGNANSADAGCHPEPVSDGEHSAH
jgi:sec-independent protein translocase protein TatB